MSDREIQVAARELLVGCFGTTTPPLPIDLDEIVYEHLYDRENLVFSDEEDLGVDRSGEEILGKMLPRAGRILVTSRLTDERKRGRYRFTVAHEIGHWRLHRPFILASLDQPGLFAGKPTLDEPILSVQRSVFSGGGVAQVGRQEYQANKFAVALLIDAGRVREELLARFDTAPMYHRRAPVDLRRSNLEEFAATVASASRRGLRPLKDVFEVSTQAMGIALRELGFVSEFEPLL